jgi:hypothetical protein
MCNTVRIKSRIHKQTMSTDKQQSPDESRLGMLIYAAEHDPKANFSQYQLAIGEIVVQSQTITPEQHRHALWTLRHIMEKRYNLPSIDSLVYGDNQ